MSIEMPESPCASNDNTDSRKEKVTALPEEIARQLSPLLLPDDVPSEALIAAIQAEQNHRPESTDVPSHFRLGSLFWDLAQSLSNSAPENTAYYADQAFDHLEEAVSCEELSKPKLDARYLFAYGNAFRYRWEPKIPKAVLGDLLENLVGIASDVPEPVKEALPAGHVEIGRIGIHLLDALHDTLSLPSGARELALLRGTGVAAQELKREAHVQYVIDQQNNCKLPHRNKRPNSKAGGGKWIISDFVGLANKAITQFMPGEATTPADAGHFALTWLCEYAGGTQLAPDQRKVISDMWHGLQRKRYRYMQKIE